MRTLRRKLLRDLWQRRAQAAAIVLTILLGTALFVASYDAYRNLQASYDRIFERLRFADLFVTGPEARAFAAAAREVPGVESVTTRVTADVPVRVGGEKLLGRVISLPVSGEPAAGRVLVLRGTGLDPALPDRVLVERHLADHFDLRPGDRLTIFGNGAWHRVTVGGIVSSAEYLWPARSRQEVLSAPGSFGVVFAPPALARRIAGAAPPNQVLVRYGPDAERAQLDARLGRLARRLGAAEVLTKAEQPSNAALSTDIQGFSELAVLFPLLFLTAAALATYLLISRRVRAERRIIGTLLATGFSRGQVVRHYLGYGLALGGLGGLLGALGGSLAAGAVTHLYTHALAIPLAVSPFRPVPALAALALGLGVGLVATAAPALAASRLTPGEAMRGLVPPARSGISLAERAVPPLRRLPVRWLHVLRSLGRNRRRAISTVLGVLLAATLVLVSWGMLDTTQILLGRQFGEIERQDATVRLAGRPDTRVLARLAGIDGVAAVEPAAEIPAVLAAGGRRYATRLVGLRPDTSMHRFLDDGRTALPHRGLIVGAALSGRLSVRPGDRLRVAVPGTGVSFEERLAGFVREPLGTFAYVDLNELKAQSQGRLEANEVLVRFRPGADRAETLARLANLPSVTAVSDADALARAVGRYMSLFYAFVGVMLAFAAAMAFAIIFTAMTANVAERATELTALRADGVRYRTLARLVTAENLLLTCLALLPGLAVGYLVAGAFMASYSSDLFSFELELRPTTPVFVAAALVLVALASQWPGLRAVRRLDVARVVREHGE